MSAELLTAVRSADLVRRLGRLAHCRGLLIESEGPDASIGELCKIARADDGGTLDAEVVGLRERRVLMMPLGSVRGIRLGHEVEATGTHLEPDIGSWMLGRVLDGLGQPLDDKPAPRLRIAPGGGAQSINPLKRAPVREILETGVKVVDSFMTLGRGQRVGIFAGSGVGKTTLLGMIARNAQADVVVLALIGERGREVQDFLDRLTAAHGAERLIVVVATSDRPALIRTKAAHTALSICEYFRDAGKNVLLIMDSLTRFAMAQREIGISIGEPPMARGYTPSVFDAMPRMVERCGNASASGSITALFTVLIEADDLNDPIADSARSVLDGGIVLSRQLAHQGHFPAIDILRSNSRLFEQLVDAKVRAATSRAIAALSRYEENRELIEIGAYKEGANPALDDAVRLRAGVMAFARQDLLDSVSRRNALAQLHSLVGP